MAFTGEQPRSRVQPDPSRARKIHLGPRVQIGEIPLRAFRTFERLYIRRQLNQIARDEAGRQAELPEDLDEKPGAAAARPKPETQRFSPRLDARLEADHV